MILIHLGAVLRFSHVESASLLNYHRLLKDMYIRGMLLEVIMDVIGSCRMALLSVDCSFSSNNNKQKRLV